LQSPTSFENIAARWVAEIKHHCPTTPFLIIGTKADLPRRVPLDRAQDIAREVRANGYYECSALTQQGLKDVFDNAIRAALNTPSSSSSKKAKKKGGFFSSASSAPADIDFVPLPPALPKGVPAPWINVMTCTISSELNALRGNEYAYGHSSPSHMLYSLRNSFLFFSSDVDFVAGGTVIPAHRMILCSSSLLFSRSKCLSAKIVGDQIKNSYFSQSLVLGCLMRRSFRPPIRTLACSLTALLKSKLPLTLFLLPLLHQKHPLHPHQLYLQFRPHQRRKRKKRKRKTRVRKRPKKEVKWKKNLPKATQTGKLKKRRKVEKRTKAKRRMNRR
jgi:hypothetical protein